MKYVWAALVLIVVAYVSYEYIRMSALVAVSEKLVSEAHAYQSATGTLSVLVLGDSTAVGVGSPSDESVAGRLGAYLNASVENHAVSGAVTADLAGQIAQAQRSHYDLILIQIGANDVIRFHSPTATAQTLNTALKLLQPKSEHIVLLTAGKIGEAPFFPRLFSWLWNWQASRMRLQFMAVASADNVAYVDLYNAPDPFSSDPARYYAPDGLHLTGDGYGFWFEQVQQTIQAHWPDLTHGSN
jgi:lysophospholipase L1-like esterase